jgi:hypothetical protein
MADHVASYTGSLYVRPVGRGIVLEGVENRPHLDEWLERALLHAGVLRDGDEWTGGGRTTEPLTITVTIEHSIQGAESSSAD